jgi:hypothetical protein
MTAVFKIQQRLDKKWNLEKNGAPMGSYESLALAKEAMGYIINPIIYQYDKNGVKIE